MMERRIKLLDTEFDFDDVCNDVIEAALLMNDAVAAGGELVDGLTVDVLIGQIEAHVQYALNYMTLSQRGEMDKILREIYEWESSVGMTEVSVEDYLYLNMGADAGLFHRFEKDVLRARASLCKTCNVEHAMMTILARDFGLGKFVSKDDIEKLIEIFNGRKEIGRAWGRFFYDLTFFNRLRDVDYFEKRTGWPFAIERKLVGDCLYCCLRKQDV